MKSRVPSVKRLACRATLLIAAAIAIRVSLRADTLDDAVEAVMGFRKIHGLSLAVIDDGEIVKARGYGVIDSETGSPVTADTLFQAGSISKPVSAVGALLLVQKNRLF